MNAPSKALLLSAPFAAMLAGHAAAEVLTAESMWKLARAGHPVVSPDGRTICFEVTRYDLAGNRGNADLHLLDLESGALRPLTSHEKSDSGAVFSPDGRRIAFVSARDGQAQAYAIPVDGGEATKLTNVKDGVANLSWSPDGKHLAFTSSVRVDAELKTIYPDLPLAEARLYDDLLFRHWDAWTDGTYSHLFVQPLAGGEPRDLMPGERCHTPLVPNGGAEEIAWSPDGAELCYTAKKGENRARSTDSDLYVVPLAGGPARCITEGLEGADRQPLYSPDGKFIAFLSLERPGFEADRARLMLHDRASGANRDLSSGFDHWVSSFCFAPDSSRLYFTSVVRGTSQIFTIDLEGNVQALTSGMHDLGAVAASRDGKTLYATRVSWLRPHELVKLSASGGEITPLTDLNGEAIGKLELPTVEERVVKASDGQDLHCFVIKPPGFDPTKKYPLLTYCQGGPQSPVSQFFSMRWNFHLMAARGYVVVAPNRRGLPGFGQAWNDAISRDWGGQAMRDYLTATDAMFAEPWIDRERAGAIGASFGGYSVYWLMGHDQEDRFQCMIAHCGLFNLESFYAATEELWFPDFDLGGPYWESAEIQAGYDRDSPHRYVGNWDTPLLVIHGDKDFRVPVTEGIQAFTAAKLRGVDSRFLWFPEEGHWISKPQNGVLWQRVFFDWLDRYLK
jgi:dipeptidyl aminopeptidase/acylaminoacyl peptidase